MFITHEGVKVNSKGGYKLIGIRYKKHSPDWKSEEDIEEGRKERMLCKEHPGAPYDIPAEYLSMNREKLLEVLNKRLNHPL